MKLSFRWYGKDDKITLQHIRQIPGMDSIVTAVYDVPVGEVWSRESIAELKKMTEDAGLKFDVIESVPVHEDIKLGKPSREKYIENYCENIRRLGEAGVKCICYNFMPVFDWTRTQLDHVLPDGSTSLVYYQEQVDKVDPLKSAHGGLCQDGHALCGLCPGKVFPGQGSDCCLPGCCRRNRRYSGIHHRSHGSYQGRSCDLHRCVGVHG